MKITLELVDNKDSYEKELMRMFLEDGIRDIPVALFGLAFPCEFVGIETLEQTDKYRKINVHLESNR